MIVVMDVWKSPFTETRQIQHKSTLLSNYRDQHFKVIKRKRQGNAHYSVVNVSAKCECYVIVVINHVCVTVIFIRVSNHNNE